MEKLYSESIGQRNNFNFLRLLFALSVMFTHAYFVYYGPDNNPEPLGLFSRHQVGFGTVVLNFFFVLSGFLVLQSWIHSKGWVDFLKKRILRIYPGFIVVCLVSAYVFGPMGNGSSSNLFPNFKSNFFAVNFHLFVTDVAKLIPPDLPETFTNLPCQNEYNTSIWTIWYEFICYLVILLAGLLGIFKQKLIPLLLFIVLYGLNIFHYRAYTNYNELGAIDWQISFLSEDSTERLLNLEHFSVFFLAGSCFYYYRDYIIKSGWLVALSILLLSISIRWVKVFELTQVIFGSYLLFSVAFSNKIRLYNFAKYGDFSYGVYLYGWPVQQLVFLYFGSKLNLPGTMLVSYLFVFPCAILSWHLVEKQCLKLKRWDINFKFLS